MTERHRREAVAPTSAETFVQDQDGEYVTRAERRHRRRAEREVADTPEVERKTKGEPSGPMQEMDPAAYPPDAVVLPPMTETEG